MSRPAPVAAFSVSTQFENVGDAWLHRELLRLARERCTTWVDLTRCPPAFADDLDADRPPAAIRVDGVGTLIVRLVAHRLRRGRATYFLSPGGYHGELGGSTLIRAWVATALLALMRAVGVRPCLIGTSYERIGPRHRAVLRARSRLLHAHVVRDAASRAVATDLGLRVDAVLPDLSFATPSAPSRARSGSDVALVFRGDQAAGQAADVVAFALALARRTARASGWRVVAQVGRDRPVADAVAAALRRDGHRADALHVDHDLDAAAAAYAGCGHVIGNRLHGLLLGAHAGCAPVALVDEHLNAKVVGAFGELGWSHRVVPSTAADAAERVAELLRPERRVTLDPQPYRDRIEAFFDDLLGHPGGPARG